jgi:hypothetical protein
MFAAMFMTIDPIAGWLGGTSGKSQRRTGRKGAGEDVHQPRGLGELHQSQPERHHASERQGEGHHGGLAGLERGVGDGLELSGEPAEQNCQDHKAEPDVIEHARKLPETSHRRKGENPGHGGVAGKM